MFFDISREQFRISIRYFIYDFYFEFRFDMHVLSLHSLNSPNSLNSLNLCKSRQICLSRMYRVRGKWLANVGRMYQVRGKWLANVGRMYRVRPIFQNGHFGEYSNSPKLANFWRVLEFDKFAGEWPLLRIYPTFWY